MVRGAEKVLEKLQSFYEPIRDGAYSTFYFIQKEWNEFLGDETFLSFLETHPIYWSLPLLVLLTCAYTVYRWFYRPFVQNFLVAEGCRVKLENTERLKVGDSIVLTISGFMKSPSEMDAEEVERLHTYFFNSLTAKVTMNEMRIPAIKAFADEEFDCLRLMFTAEQSGTFQMELRYNGFLLPGCPLDVTVPPDFLCPLETDVVFPTNPIIVTEGVSVVIEILPKDRTGYPCTWEGVQLDKFDFHAATEDAESCDPSFCGKIIEIVGEHFNEGLNAMYSYAGSAVLDQREVKGPVKVLLTLRPKRYPNARGILEGQICYDGEIVKNGCFPIVSLSKDEYQIVQLSLREPKATDTTQFKAQLLETISTGVDGDERRNLTEWYVPLPGPPTTTDDLMATTNPGYAIKEVFVNISMKFICVKEVVWTVLLARTALFPVQGETKIEVLPETELRKNYFVTIVDTSQNQSVRLLMTAKDARMLMALFLKFRGNQQGSALAFVEKSNYFFQRVKEHSVRMVISNRDPFQFISVSRPDVIRTSYEETKKFEKGHWYNPFIVSFLGEPLLEESRAWQEWSHIILDSALEHNPDGMFQIVSDKSGYIHPNPSRSYRRWSIQYYELAGKIIGKYLVERAQDPMSPHYRVKARFSRSFLLQLIGSPPTANSMERDLPEVFESTLKSLYRSNQKGDNQLVFCVPLYDIYGKLDQMVPIIENGEHIQVTSENTELYLNALARYHLATKVSREILAFRSGFIHIIPEDFLLHFDENELELLLCGWSKMDIDEVKRYHEVVGEHWHPEFPRVVRWFWNSLSNMSSILQGRFLQFCTGSSILPEGGFSALNPCITLSMTCLYGQLPVADPTTHNICLSDHPNYEAFDEAFIAALRASGCCVDKPRLIQCRHTASDSSQEIRDGDDKINENITLK